jgi:hypothetical protein
VSGKNDSKLSPSYTKSIIKFYAFLPSFRGKKNAMQAANNIQRNHIDSDRLNSISNKPCTGTINQVM